MPMFDRLQKPFLTVETGEAYQPIRLSYSLINKESLIKTFDGLKCLRKNPTSESWTWYWQEECDDLHFESLENYRKNPESPLRLATVTLKDSQLFINLPSFKRACLAVTFFDRIIPHEISKIRRADFINKVFGIDEKLPHGFAELLKEEELEKLIFQREHEYQEIQERCAQAPTADKAFEILSEYSRSEAQKPLPFAERYVFEESNQDPEIIFLGFYIFLRGRELVAIKRWYGETGYTLADLADETLEQVFGGVGIDIIE